MTVEEIKALVMSQTNSDAGDVEEFMPYLLDYINEGYDRLVWAYAKQHLLTSGTYVRLTSDMDVPKLPDWTQPGIAHWATWCIYRNGNPSKQSRGYQFRSAAEELAAQIRLGTATTVHICNMPD